MRKPNRESIGFMIRLIYDALGSQLDNKLRPMGLTHSQASVIAFLRTREDIPTSVTDIRNELNVAAPTALGIVRRLEKKGYVSVFTDGQDQRVRLVVLNRNQVVPVEESFRYAAEMEDRLLAGFSEEERENLIRYLNRVYQNVQ